jgi:hypothetical protein
MVHNLVSVFNDALYVIKHFLEFAVVFSLSDDLRTLSIILLVGHRFADLSSISLIVKQHFRVKLLKPVGH